MSNFNYLEYGGHSIFRGQPHHSYFDKPFEDEEDCVFQCLHDIEPYFLKPEQKLATINKSNIELTDPRTQKPINHLCYDHTKEKPTKLFMSPKQSIISKEQHELGVRVLSAMQQSLEVEAEDLFQWHRLDKTRLKENQYFQKFVNEFQQNSKEKIYTPCRKLLELYQKWYKTKAIQLMKRYPQESYNTHLGLPHVRLCKNVLKEQHIQIANQEIVMKLGNESQWHDKLLSEFKTFKYSIDSYAELYINSEDLNDSLNYNLQKQFVTIEKQEMSECPVFYIPLESLLFLVTAGDYIDMPMELLLNIKEAKYKTTDFNKYIIMDEPLPSREGGWHTYQHILEQCALALISIKQTEVTKTECSNVLNNFTNFKVSTLEDFMQSSTKTPDKLCRFNKSLIKWQLSSLDENEAPYQLYTTLSTFASNKDISLKLEYKPTFGCEILTKYELLKQWFKLKLLKKTKSKCLRVHNTNFQTLTEESLNINKLQASLYTNYHINCQQLLNNLYEFLKMLYNMPVGHYMLRFNPKFKDKLMLCKPSKELTQNTIHLHQLLQTDVNDLLLMSQTDFLPIDANLCSLMHLQHNILPATFSPHVVVKRRVYNPAKSIPPRHKNPIVKAKEQTKSTMNNSKMKRMRKRERLFAKFKTKRSEQQELEEEMELDRKILGF